MTQNTQDAAAASPSAASAGHAAATKETTMGTEYYVACRDCKKVRGLDKFYAMTIPANGRPEALALGDELKNEGWSFRCALLTSFLWHHKGHNCTVFSEYDEEFMSMVPLADEPNAGDYEDDSDRFWKA